VSESEVPSVTCIVEGHGEAQALPVLIRRIAAQLDPPAYVDVSIGRRTSRSMLVRAGGIEAAVEDAAFTRESQQAILILLDADDDCPAELGPRLLARALAARGDRTIGLALAEREYKAWFLAAAVSLAGKRGLPADLQPPAHPERIRGAKEWLADRLPPGRGYKETVDQPALTALFDLQEARSADSFDKCYREIARLIAALT